MTRLHGNAKFTIGELREAARESNSNAELYRRLGYADQPSLGMRKKLRNVMDENKISYEHFIQDAPKQTRRRTKEELQDAVLRSKSYTDLIKNLGLRVAGSNLRCVKAALTRNEICVDHFNASSNINKTSSCSWNRKDVEELHKKLLDGEVRKEVKSRTLTALMQRMKTPYQCVSCGISEWKGIEIRLEVDHVDGDRTNRSRNNLRYMCPNCHSQTETYGSKNRR